jgi:hypothetical protein
VADCGLQLVKINPRPMIRIDIKPCFFIAVSPSFA